MLKREKKTDKEKYLGDILSSSAKVDANVLFRYNKGVGIVNQIIGMLKEVSFGHHYFEMALLFRDSMLINGMLCSVKTLYGLTNSHIEQLEQCDTMLMRRLFKYVSSTAIEAFYIETGMILPLRFTIIARRLMYMCTILQKSDGEVVKQVYEAQKLSPVKNDWSTQVEQDLKYCKSISLLKNQKY